MDTGPAGRDRELALPRRRLADAVDGRGGVLLVAGEPGIGKSALVTAFAALASGQGVPVAVGLARELPLPTELRRLIGYRLPRPLSHT